MVMGTEVRGSGTWYVVDGRVRGKKSGVEGK